MSDLLEQLDETPEIITPDQAEANVPEPDQNPDTQAPPQEDFQERNWKAARARMEEDAREKRWQKQQIDLLQQELELLRKSMPRQEAVEEDLSHFTDTEKQLYQEIKQLKTHISQNKAKESDYVVDRLRSKYPDFDDVVNPENITYLQTNNAALAKALASLKDDPYEQGLAAYDVLRKTEWFQQRNTMEDKARMEQNAKKPMSVQAVRKQGALSEANTFANGLTPELKKQLQKEMADSRKRA